MVTLYWREDNRTPIILLYNQCFDHTCLSQSKFNTSVRYSLIYMKDPKHLYFQFLYNMKYSWPNKKQSKPKFGGKKKILSYYLYRV